MRSWLRVLSVVAVLALAAIATGQEIGREVAVSHHLQDGEEQTLPTRDLLAHGKLLFEAMWTVEEGGGRPLSSGTGGELSDPSDPLLFPRNFNRISAPDANSCAGCHNLPRSGGGGDIVANVFVLGQRFDFATFSGEDAGFETKGSFDERGVRVDLDGIANSRATTSMFGSGYLEMLARQMSIELRRIRDAMAPGTEAQLVTKGVSFGTLRRNVDGSFDVSGVEGLSPAAIRTGGPDDPTLIVMPFHQASAVTSLRQFTNNAFNHHHGIQSTERFGVGTDPDGDGVTDEMTVADVTAASLWQAALPVPGRVIPRNRAIERAILRGEQAFAEIGCTSCHVPALPLEGDGNWFFEPNPFNPPGNLRPEDGVPVVAIDLNDRSLPGPRLRAGADGVTWVPAYTDMKLHDITSGPDDPNRETLNMHFPAGSDEFFAGNSRFLTKRLWGAANERPYFHHGKYTTLREAILAHAGEAADTTAAFVALPEADRNAIVEFLKSLQVLPAGSQSLAVDEEGRPRNWPPAGR